MAISTFDGWVGYSGGEVLLRVGDEWPDDHVLVTDKPDMFEVEPEPEDTTNKTGSKAPWRVTPEPEPVVSRRKPGPKPGTPRTKPQT